MKYHEHRIQTIRKAVSYPQEALPAWSHPDSRSYLISRGISKEEAEFYDLGYVINGFWFKRLIIPIYFAGRLECLQGRALVPEMEPRYKTEGWRSCYQPNTDAKEDRLVVVEGPFDLYAVARVHKQVVATLGNQPSYAQIQQVLAIPRVKKISILYDKEALTEAYALQLILNTHFPTGVLMLEDNKDAGECALDQIKLILG